MSRALAHTHPSRYRPNNLLSLQEFAIVVVTLFTWICEEITKLLTLCHFDYPARFSSRYNPLRSLCTVLVIGNHLKYNSNNLNHVKVQ